MLEVDFFERMTQVANSGAVLQKLSGEHDGRDAPFLLSLGCHSKQVGDERDLPQNVPFLHATHLPLPDHVHDFIPL